MSRLAKGEQEGWGANWANPPPSDPAPALQLTLTFQVSYGVGG